VQEGVGNKGYAATRKEPTFSESSPVILEPVFVSAHNNETVCEVAKSENSSVQEVPVCDVSQDL
jgi:hypothetical protein